MKKILILSILFMFCSPALALMGGNEPQWGEFFPYDPNMKLEYQENNTISNTARVWLCLSIIGVPYAAFQKNKEDRILENNYWTKRKENFDRAVNTCKSLSSEDQKISCYNDVRKIEQSKNNTHAIQNTQPQINYIYKQY